MADQQRERCRIADLWMSGIIGKEGAILEDLRGRDTVTRDGKKCRSRSSKSVMKGAGDGRPRCHGAAHEVDSLATL